MYSQLITITIYWSPIKSIHFYTLPTYHLPARLALIATSSNVPLVAHTLKDTIQKLALSFSSVTGFMTQILPALSIIH